MRLGSLKNSLAPVLVVACTIGCGGTETVDHGANDSGPTTDAPPSDIHAMSISWDYGRVERFTYDCWDAPSAEPVTVTPKFEPGPAGFLGPCVSELDLEDDGTLDIRDTYSYSGEGRLTTIERDWGLTTPDGIVDERITYDYDGGGQLVGAVAITYSSANGEETQRDDYSYRRNGEAFEELKDSYADGDVEVITSHRYDAAGNLLHREAIVQSGSGAGSWAWTYSYDGATPATATSVQAGLQGGNDYQGTVTYE
jgi:hypothetical protein